MKKMLLMTVAFAIIISGCSNMTSAVKPDIMAKDDTAVLVIVRDSFMFSGSVFQNYLDGKMIGETTGKSWFATEVSPGRHYVVVTGGVNRVALIDFQPGKIYALLENAYWGPWRALPREFWPLSYVETVEMIKPCEYLEYTGKGRDLDPSYYQSIIEQFDGETKNNPEVFQAFQMYVGF